MALVTFERREEEQDILLDLEQGACGWMVALAPDVETAKQLIVRDLEHHGLRVIEIADEQEIFSEKEIEEFDAHLAANFREIKPGKQTVWGTIFSYKGEGEA